MPEAAIREAFAKQAEWCRQLGSPFTALLCDSLYDGLDRTTATGTRVLDWSGDAMVDALALRLTGALHALVRRGRLPALAALYPPNALPGRAEFDPILADTLKGADAELRLWLDSAPQTNEVARSAVLYAGLLVIADATGKPISLYELGASAGLNLRLDSYGYTLGGERFGRDDAAVQLAPEWTGTPLPRAHVEIAARRGVDLNPLDVTDAATRERLLAYIWPDQPARLARLTAALDAAAADPPALDRGDAAAWVEANVRLHPGLTTVVQHSIAFTYFPKEAQRRIAAHLERLGDRATADSPLAWLRFEHDEMGKRPTLRLQLWPGVEDRLLAHVHPHGAEIRWVSE